MLNCSEIKSGPEQSGSEISHRGDQGALQTHFMCLCVLLIILLEGGGHKEKVRELEEECTLWVPYSLFTKCPRVEEAYL